MDNLESPGDTRINLFLPEPPCTNSKEFTVTPLVPFLDPSIAFEFDPNGETPIDRHIQARKGDGSLQAVAELDKLWIDLIKSRDPDVIPLTTSSPQAERRNCAWFVLGNFAGIDPSSHPQLTQEDKEYKIIGLQPTINLLESQGYKLTARYTNPRFNPQYTDRFYATAHIDQFMKDTDIQNYQDECATPFDYSILQEGDIIITTPPNSISNIPPQFQETLSDCAILPSNELDCNKDGIPDAQGGFHVLYVGRVTIISDHKESTEALVLISKRGTAVELIGQLYLHGEEVLNPDLSGPLRVFPAKDISIYRRNK
jgi:hypothetical protein